MLLLLRALRAGWIQRFAGLMVLVVLAVGAASAAQNERPAEPGDVDATLSQARKQIDEIRERLADGGEDAQLVRWRNEVLDIQSEAAGLAETLTPQLADVTARLSQLGQAPEGARETGDVAAQRSQLQQDNRKLDAQTKLARLLAVEAAQTAEQISGLRRTQFQAQLGERRDSVLGDTYWKELRSDLPRDWGRLRELGGELKESAAATQPAIWVALAAAIIVTLFLRRTCSRWLLRITATRVPPGRLRRSFLAISIVALTSATPGIIAALLYFGLTWNTKLDDDVLLLLRNLAIVACFGGYTAGLGRALLSPERSTWRLPSIPDNLARGLRHFPTALGILVVVIWLGDHLPILIDASLTTTILVASLTAIMLTGTLAWGLRRWRILSQSAPHAEGSAPPQHPLWVTVLATLAWATLICSAISILAGFVAFGGFLVKQVMWTLTVLCSAYLLSVLIADGFTTLLAPRPGDDEEPGTRAHGQAAVLLAGVGRVTVGFLAVSLLVAPFGEGPTDLMHRMNLALGGLQIGEVELRPRALVQGFGVLAVCLLSVRVLKKWLADRYLPTTALDPGMQLSAATLFGYAGVVVAVALALSALGLGLERVAWIASALSVGIGFGMQAVVQNFVSGLILLAERPVKVGDWVSLGGLEGDIQRINVRATEIQMGDRSTVIVPNSEFITKTVRNVTHENPIGVVQVKLPMPFETDVQRVREILLEAFTANEGVLESPPPDVFLEGIENGRLIFNAKGFVSTPRSAYGVRSALLYEILQKLAEAKLPLSTPSTMLLASGTTPATEAGEAETAGRSKTKTGLDVPSTSAAVPPTGAGEVPPR
jgi:potassium efflux system protein